MDSGRIPSCGRTARHNFAGNGLRRCFGDSDREQLCHEAICVTTPAAPCQAATKHCSVSGRGNADLPPLLFSSISQCVSWPFDMGNEMREGRGAFTLIE